MTPTDEQLMAYADGALSADEAARIEAAIAADPALRQQVEAHRALRAAIAQAYGTILAQPPPQRLTDAVERGGPRLLPAWSAVAAALVVGVSAGIGGWSLGQGGLTGGAGGLEARGALKAELDDGLTSLPQAPNKLVRVGLSYRTANGYCRTFSIQNQRPWTGVACRAENGWIIQTALHIAPAAGANTAYRQAASGLPAPLLQTIEDTIIGAPLNADQEAAAKAAGWRLADR